MGTWGGDKFSTVTIFMDGFSEGIDYYNKQKNKNVKLVGWNEATQNGVFIGGKSAFDDALDRPVQDQVAACRRAPTS